jgi:hypothetical protein
VGCVPSEETLESTAGTAVAFSVAVILEEVKTEGEEGMTKIGAIALSFDGIVE